MYKKNKIIKEFKFALNRIRGEEAIVFGQNVSNKETIRGCLYAAS
jgi:hypothetical protein